MGDALHVGLPLDGRGLLRELPHGKDRAPAGISLTGVGTNPTFYADPSICSNCHSNITAASVQTPVLAKLDTLRAELQNAVKNSMVHPHVGVADRQQDQRCIDDFPEAVELPPVVSGGGRERAAVFLRHDIEVVRRMRRPPGQSLQQLA
jgi:hypothetical protein